MNKALKVETTWVRQEGLSLLHGAHDTMARVLLAQFAVIGAAVVAGNSVAGNSVAGNSGPPGATALAVAALCVLSGLGAFYSFEQLRHSRFLHLYLLQVGPIRFVQDLHRLRKQAKKANRSVKRRGWEERVCLAGYATAPAILLLGQVAAPASSATPWIFYFIVPTVIGIVVLWMRCTRAFEADKANWEWYFKRCSTTIFPTIFRAGRFRFYFFSREEARMHVHAQSADGEAKFCLNPTIELAMSYNLKEKDLSKVRQLVEKHKDEIRAAWEKHFGR